MNTTRTSLSASLIFTALVFTGCAAQQEAAEREESTISPYEMEGQSQDYTRRSNRTTTATSAPVEQPASEPEPVSESEEYRMDDSVADKDAPASPQAVTTKSSKQMVKKESRAKGIANPKTSNMVAPKRDMKPVAPELTTVPSTSGTSEDYENHGVNPMTKTSEDKLSTFSIDVDTGAYTIARRKLNEGVMPPAASVRVEEFVNYFNYNYPQPDDSGPFGVSLEAAPSPFVASSSDRYLVRVGVQGKRIARKDRKPVHLVFLVDVSGSMNRPDKLGLAKESLKVLTNNLTENDTVGLVTYAGSTRAVLQPTSITEKGKILEGIDSLTSGGGTAMNSGMETAYKMAMQSSKPGHVTRVIVLSDGDANIGPVSFDDILKNVKSYVDEGVTLSTIGFGMGNYKDSLMEQLANKGNGNYYYIDTIKEARKVFGEQADGTLEVIAKDVKIQVEFNPEVVDSYRLVGYENRDIADKDFRNDRVDAGEIGAGHSVTAFYEVVLTGAAPQGNLAYVRMRHKQPDGYDATEQIFSLAASELKDKLNDASKDFQFGAAVVAFAEILRGSPYAKNLNLDLVMEVAQAASSSSQKDRAEFIELVKKAKRLSN